MVYCMGHECSVMNTCLRYTQGLSVTVSDGCEDKYMRKCTSQKKYLQDERKVNEDGKRQRLCLK